MQVSHSRISTFVKCPYQYKLKYIDKLETLPNDDPQNGLIVGHALHTGIEKDLDAAIKEYYNGYPVINDLHVNEAMKLEYWIPKIKDLLPKNGLHEVKLIDSDYIGFIDYLAPVELPFDHEYEMFDLYDFKYSNNISSYLESEQLHLYKYYFEKLNPTKKIRKMYFMFVPKCNLRIKYQNKTNPRDETLYEFRQRILADLDQKKIEFVEVEYNANKVIDFLTNSKHAIEATEFPKQETKLCDWCDYQKYCQEGIDYEII